MGEEITAFRLYIKDDYGAFWYFDQERGHIVCDGDDTPDGGYSCDSLVDGYRELIRLGYITNPAWESEEDDG